MRPTLRLTAAAVLLTAALGGCTATVPLKPAADATNPDCAAVIVRLPQVVDSKKARETNAQGTAAWGSPASVLLHCGVDVPAPTAALVCVTVEGVDWLRDDSGDPVFVFTTYGRDPAVQVVVDSRKASGLNTLTDLADAVGIVKQDGKCISPDDVETPTPTPTG